MCLGIADATSTTAAKVRSRYAWTVMDGIIGISEGAISNELHQPNRSAFAVARARVAASCAICVQSPV
jgi:hypothetical protein